MEVAYKNNIWTKVNILLYLGENKNTLEESCKWLDENKKYFKGVSVNPFILYLNGESTKNFIKDIEMLTQSKVDQNVLNNKGYTYVDLSVEFKIDKLVQISKKISDRYMTKMDYLDLKNICYFKRKLKY